MWLVALVVTALVALLFSVCDSGGHHRAALPDRPATAAAAPAPGCPGQHSPCTHAYDEHVAGQVPERHDPDAPDLALAGAPVPRSAPNAVPPPFVLASPAADSGRALLCKVCVTRT
ncbi:hypothetical protein [Streptomyces roseolus]|uniref:hypothetical protein n=1 Tax=Streptomyces roseolus TaxID=67358 RepID=UPI00378BD931